MSKLPETTEKTIAAERKQALEPIRKLLEESFIEQIRKLQNFLGCPDDFKLDQSEETIGEILNKIEKFNSAIIDCCQDNQELPFVAKTKILVSHVEIIKYFIPLMIIFLEHQKEGKNKDLQKILRLLVEAHNKALKETIIPTYEKQGAEKYSKAKAEKMRANKNSPKKLLFPKAMELFTKARETNPKVTAYRFARDEKNIEALKEYAESIGFKWDSTDKERCVETWLREKNCPSMPASPLK